LAGEESFAFFAQAELELEELELEELELELELELEEKSSYNMHSQRKKKQKIPARRLPNRTMPPGVVYAPWFIANVCKHVFSLLSTLTEFSCRKTQLWLSFFYFCPVT
jgi:hypothetical protein